MNKPQTTKDDDGATTQPGNGQSNGGGSGNGRKADSQFTKTYQTLEASLKVLRRPDRLPDVGRI